MGGTTRGRSSRAPPDSLADVLSAATGSVEPGQEIPGWLEPTPGFDAVVGGNWPGLLHPHLCRESVTKIANLVNQVTVECHVAAIFELHIANQSVVHATHLRRGELRLAEI